jgi:CHASE2 domain-containing sensor protein
VPDERRTGRSRWPHVIWATIVVAVVSVFLFAVSRTEQPAGQCSGLGWGCTLSGGDLAAFTATLIVPPAVLVLLIGHVIIAIVQQLARRASQQRQRRRQ